MRTFAKLGAVSAAFLAVAAFTAVPAMAGTGSGTITPSGSPACTFTFTYTGSAPATITSSSITLGGTCPAGLTVSPISIDYTAPSQADITGTVSQAGCTFDLADFNSGTYSLSLPNWNASWAGSATGSGGFLCSLITISATATISGTN